ncbi:hypothetical protein DY000_02024718 [Brassica cretica]|uniref:Uncharacterized protein n=1 Tax=Brassica cretica TaxID=69181 RepID=A0ABQ7EH02_BRACR|nr:hypothetical protein DY000_02024718 [Brassica cretica]
MPHSTFHPLLYKQLINLATATNYLPDVVGKILLIQGTNIKNPVATTKVVIALLLSRTDLKHEVVIITSINPRVCKGKLILISTHATRFYCDSTNDLSRSFNQRNIVSNHS